MTQVYEYKTYWQEAEENAKRLIAQRAETLRRDFTTHFGRDVPIISVHNGAILITFEGRRLAVMWEATWYRVMLAPSFGYEEWSEEEWHDYKQTQIEERKTIVFTPPATFNSGFLYLGCRRFIRLLEAKQ